jgi:Taurine catabolism dioxygenase TauD, TfdA family
MTTAATPPDMQPIDGPRAWYGRDLNQSEAWLHRFTDRELSEIEDALRQIVSLTRELATVTKEDFPLPTLGPVLEEKRQEVLDGRGFVVMRGIPIDNYNRAEQAAIFWGLGQWMGKARSQNGKGHLLGHVCNLGYDVDDPNVRIYQTKERQTFHTDSCDIVSLMCLHNAREGGLSAVVSATTVYNEVLARRPELAPCLFDPIATDRRGEIPPGMQPWFNVPVLNWHQGELTPLYQRNYVDSAQLLDGAPTLSNQQVEALNLFDSLCDDPNLHISMMLEQGDIQYVSNHSTLHDRSGYTEWPEPERRRHLLRLWLCPPMGRELPPIFAERYGPIAIGNRGGIVLSDTEYRVPLEPE